MRQLHVAETEKYAHVTYFFNGGVEEAFPGEERVLVPSRRDVPTYDLAPEMSAAAITGEVVTGIGSGEFDFILVNYANPTWWPTPGSGTRRSQQAEFVDGCLARLLAATTAAGGALLITADHGNIEESARSGMGRRRRSTPPPPVPSCSSRPTGRRPASAMGPWPTWRPRSAPCSGSRPPPSMTGRSLIVD
jgi:2,3-bisphosphoglycerate-independent phosphoglycerate mutase